MRLKQVVLATLGILAGIANASDFKPDPALADTIESLTQRSDAGLVVEALADGSSMLDIQGRYQNVTLAAISDGKARTQCVTSLAEANDFFGVDLRSGAPLERPKQSDSALQETAQRHGMSTLELTRYLAMIQAFEKSRAPSSATITIVNLDGVGEGLNDTTPRSSEGGNTGTTLGAQRLNVFNRAAQIWGQTLDSTITIRVDSRFDPITPCASTSGVLGFAGPNTIHQNFSGAPFSNTFYHAALANKIARSDLSSGNSDISATFNSSVGVGSCLTGLRFYLGLDNLTPSNTINLLVTALHELGHGLGSSSFANPDGSYAGGNPDTWSRLMFDRTQNRSWFAMSNAQRVSSSTNNGNLVWDGPNVNIAAGFLTAGRDAEGRVRLFAPSTFQEGSSVSHFDSAASPNLLMEPAINAGLPLTLDLTRQQMRDVGWFRDQNNDGLADTITDVFPNSGSFAPNTFLTVTWDNSSGFSDNVSIEFSSDGGLSFPTILADNVINTGSRSITVPNTLTTQARIRVRSFSYVAPVGVSSANFTIAAPNTAPSISTLVGQSRVQGEPGANAQIATVSDAQTPSQNLTVTATNVPSNITISNITVATGGQVSAIVAAACTAPVATAAIELRVSDGSLTSNANFSFNVTANPQPTLTYPSASLDELASLVVNANAGPSDNTSGFSVALQSAGTFTGNISVNQQSGAVTLSNARPVGSHNVTIRMTDSCGAIRDAVIPVTVRLVNTAPSFTASGTIIRQQGSPAGALVALGTVSDTQTPVQNINVSLVSGGSAFDVQVSDLTNNNGQINARVTAGCNALGGNIRLQFSDGTLTSTADVIIGVSTNTPPSLGTYSNQQLNLTGSANVLPSAPPSDNGQVNSLAIALNPNFFAGSFSIQTATGLVSLSNAGPVGQYDFLITARDNCNASTERSLQLQVVDGFRDGFED